jgi:hypothetical protein
MEPGQRDLALVAGRHETHDSLAASKPNVEIAEYRADTGCGLGFLQALPALTGLIVSGTLVEDLGPILEHPNLLYDVSNLDYRDRMGFFLDFEDTPATRNHPALHAIALLDGNTDAGLRQKALREHFGIAPH